MIIPISVDCFQQQGCLALPRASLINANGIISIYDPDITTGCNIKLPIQMNINFQSTPFPLLATPIRIIAPQCQDSCTYLYSREFLLYWPNAVQRCGPQGLISFDINCCCVNKAGTLYSEFTSLLSGFVWYTVYINDSNLSRNTFLANTCIDINNVAPLTDASMNFVDYGSFNYTLTPIDPSITVTPLPVESYVARTRSGGSDCISLILVKGYDISRLRPPILSCAGVDVTSIQFAIAQIDCFCITERAQPPPPPPNDIFNTKEDYEVMKGLWIGNYAYEEYKDTHITKRAKVIDLL